MNAEPNGRLGGAFHLGNASRISERYGGKKTRRLAGIVLLGIAWGVALGDEGYKPRTYETVYTPKANRAYVEDINVWVYTREFAERFGMPEEWIDEDLKGALAIAFRKEVPTARSFFPHKGPDVWMRDRECILDVYLDEWADIQWVDNQIADFIPYRESWGYLVPQKREDWMYRRRPVGLPDVVPGGVEYGIGKWKSGGLLVRSYASPA